ncbi:WD repeat-containing protein JIP5 [Vanrija pseudolonga]|uniref:WD repeat-containing protein JIP5 n=1 Tax=Vanrija pseudolonga TaxID=143232 RepID=A0AAF0YJB7_9TREE|nr:WD repeat-containing protein JIP5 [Vanrija pseudolonga]
MPDITLKNQPFDLAFHPSEPVLYSSLLTGEVKAWRYDDTTGETERAWTVRPTKKTARALGVEGDGKSLWVGGKSGILCGDSHVREGSSTRFWDSRKPGDAIRTYTQHYDYISGFSYFEDKRQLVTTSGDGHLSAIDIRSSKAEPLTVSEDQEDELLSIAPIKGGSKVVVGTGLGILTVWNRKLGWGDCVDRIPGHPASVDAIVALTDDCIATGSEDGLVRVMQIQPNKFLGVIATHDEYPIERLALDRNRKWLGSVSHDQCIKLTDVEDLFVDSDDEDAAMDDNDDSDDDDEMGAGAEAADDAEEDEDDEDAEEAADEDDSDVEMNDEEEEEEEAPKTKLSRRGQGIHHAKHAKAEPEDTGFFDDL